MSRRTEAYTANLKSILEFTAGRHMLTLKEVRAYTGIQNHTTLHARFPFQKAMISAETLALCLSGGERP